MTFYTCICEHAKAYVKYHAYDNQENLDGIRAAFVSISIATVVPPQKPRLAYCESKRVADRADEDIEAIELLD